MGIVEMLKIQSVFNRKVRGSTTGYVQRRMVKALEDVVVKYDGTVRDGYNNIIQFLYGEDGIDATHIETQKFDILDLNRHDFQKKYNHHQKYIDSLSDMEQEIV